MLTVSCIATLLFFGGWNAPFGLTDGAGRRLVPDESRALHVLLYLAARDVAALRYDRLMEFGWKVLLPVATLNLVVTAVVVALSG